MNASEARGKFSGEVLYLMDLSQHMGVFMYLNCHLGLWISTCLIVGGTTCGRDYTQV